MLTGLETEFFVWGPAGDLNGKMWSPDHIFWSPINLIQKSHKHTNVILYVTLHARKVTNEEPKSLKTTFE